MAYLLILLAAVILLAGYMRFEAGFAEVVRVDFAERPDKGLKIIQLSDLHVGNLMVPWKKIKAVLNEEKPDLLLLTGDFIENKSQMKRFFKFIDYIKGKHISYACFGNHEYKAMKGDAEGIRYLADGMERRGITILHDRSETFIKDSRKFGIIGISDVKTGSGDYAKALASCPGDVSAKIAFSHNPDIALRMPANSVDYLICGHFHGGQVWLPFGLEFKALRHEKLCKMGIRSGLHTVNGIKLYISRGLGNVLFPLRLGSRPEITVYNI